MTTDHDARVARGRAILATAGNVDPADPIRRLTDLIVDAVHALIADEPDGFEIGHHWKATDAACRHIDRKQLAAHHRDAHDDRFEPTT